ncbi:MAG: ATP phosphoribosyltransferase, partial [Bacteroidales bacterium]|nr:ATP phosphoribosyltransferase [Bacteroidales bacterium]
NYYEVLDLAIGKCKFIVAALPNVNLFNTVGHIKIGSKYPKVAKDYFKSRGMDVEIIKIEGSVELGPLLGICQGIVDIMETGTTLKENGLIVLDANGNELKDGDSIVVIKDLPVKGAPRPIKAGTKVKNIRLSDGDHNISCKIDGFGAMALKSEFVRKS